MFKLKAKKHEEPPADRAARRTANATIWMAIFTLILATISVATLIEIRRGEPQTADLVAAANIQAHAATGFAESAESMNKSIAAAVEKLKQQAEASERSAKTSEQSLTNNQAALRLEQSPWLGVTKVVEDPQQDGSLRIRILIKNVGKTPAFEVHSFLAMREIPASEPPPSFVFDEKAAKGSALMLPNPPESDNISLQGSLPNNVVFLYKSGTYHAYLGLAIWYRDYWGKNHKTQYCQYFQPESQQWVARKPEHCED
jgi:hypothetical protein